MAESQLDEIRQAALELYRKNHPEDHSASCPDVAVEIRAVVSCPHVRWAHEEDLEGEEVT